MQNMQKSFCLFVLLWLHIPSAAEATRQSSLGQADLQWTFVQPAMTAQGIPIRIVAYDEPWEDVVRDVQERFPRALNEEALKVGLYGHGAFVAPHEVVSQNILFVAALGLSAAMDVMVFPQWQFPQKNPLWEIPNKVFQALWDTPPKKLRATMGEVLQRHLRQLDQENRSATAHAALRLAQGI